MIRICLSNWNKPKIVILIMEESLFVLLPYLIFFVALPLSRNHIIDLFIYTVFMFTLQEHEVHEGGLFINAIVFNKSSILVDHWHCIVKKKPYQNLTFFPSQKSYSMPIGIEFQRRYATIVLELEQLNKDLNKVLHKVQQYCYEVGSLYKVVGVWPWRIIAL